MKENGFRKGLVYAIVVLFIGASIVPLTGIGAENHCLINDSIGYFNSIRESEERGVNVTLNGTMGENGWYISCVYIQISFDPDVCSFWYQFNGGSWCVYTEPLGPICEDGEYTFCWFYVDNEGNQSDVECIDFKIDQTDPTINLTIEKIGFRKWLITADVYDETSGVAKLELYLNGELLFEVTEPPYEWVVTNPKKDDKVQAIVYDNAGNKAIRKIVAFSQSQSQSGSSTPVPLVENVSNNRLSYSFVFIEPGLQTVTSDDVGYTLLQMPGCMAIGKQAGAPMLPVKSVKLLIPAMKTVMIVNVVGNSVELTGVEKPVFPYQNPVPIGFEPEDFEIDTDVYASDLLYPSRIYDGYHVGYSHGYAILDITLNPVQYIPGEGRLFYYPEITVTIDLEDTGEVNQFFRNDPEDKSWVEKLVYNPEVAETYTDNLLTFDYPGGLCNPNDDYDYVIITTTKNGLDHWDTTSSIPYNWQSLMDKHEQDDGLRCTLVTIQNINACPDYYNSDPLFNDTEAHIREFCKDAYEDWGTSYIFVGGDDEWIPARHMKYAYESNVDSDIYWSNLDNTFNEDHDVYWGEEGDLGFDLYSELFIGRITCDTPQDVSNWMTKSFYYADATDEDYLENAAFYGGAPCGDDIIDFAAIKGTNSSWLGFLFGFETWNALNPDNEYNLSVKWTDDSSPNPGWQGGNAVAGFKNAINNDHVTLLSGIAHAKATMSLDIGMNSWESDYHNTKPFFIYDLGSHCGDMDAADDGVLHSMLFHSDTELAFACVYNTCYGWGSCNVTNSSSAVQMKLFWDYIFDLENNSGSPINWQLGKAMAWSKDTMAPTINWTYSGAPGSWRAIIQGCLLFGDPAQRIKAPDFTPCYPVFNGTMCEGGWFITPVNVSFIYDPEIVTEIRYQVCSGEWTVYTEPFVIYEQGEIDFLWYWIFDGGQSIVSIHTLRIDYSPPELALITPEEGKVYLFGELLFEKEIARTIILGKIAIDVDAIDELSGIGNITFSLVKNSKPPETYVSETLPHIWELTGRHIGKYMLTVTAYDQGGLSVNTTLNMIIIQLGILEIR